MDIWKYCIFVKIYKNGSVTACICIGREPFSAGSFIQINRSILTGSESELSLVIAVKVVCMLTSRESTEWNRIE